MITKFVTIIVMCILISQPLTYNTVYAHNSNNPTDPPGPSPPKIKVTVTMDYVKLYTNLDDPTSTEVAEMVFGYGIKQEGHDIVTHVQSYDHDFETWKFADPNKTSELDDTISVYHEYYNFCPQCGMPKYEHIECSPMTDVIYFFKLVESDQSIENSMVNMASDLGGLGLAIFLPEATGAGILLGVVGIVTSLGESLNSDDDLGFTFGSKSESGQMKTLLQGSGGAAEVGWTIMTEEIPDPEGECSQQVGSNSRASLDQSQSNFLIDNFFENTEKSLALNPSSKMEMGLTDTTKEKFQLLKEQTPKKLLQKVDNVFDVYAKSLDNSYEKKRALELATNAKNLASKGKYDEALDTYKSAFEKLTVQYISKNTVTKTEIPSWLKQNAKWWSDGTTTDREFANSIGFLVKEKIITVNVPTNNDGTILVNENLQIPDWLRNNAKWWSDEIISDQEFTSGIEFMIKQKIITFSENSTSDKFNELYTISKRNEAITSSLIEINQYEKKILRDTLDDAWEKYNKSKNPDDLKSAQIFDENLKNIEKRILVLSKTELLAKQDTQSLLKNAAKDGIKMMDLEKSAKGKIWTKVRPDTPEKLVQALKDVENANKQQIKDLEKTLDTLLFGSGTTSKDGTKVSPLSGDFFDSSKFFADYFVITDHIPIQDVFNDNWTELQETRSVILEIGEFVFDEPLDLQHDEIIQDNTETKDEQPSSEIPLDGKQVSILVINGKYYPQSQFYEVPAHQPNCDAMHYHSEFPQVRSVEGVLISDPNPSTCGFGKTGLIPIDVITMTQEQIDSFKAAMGFEP